MSLRKVLGLEGESVYVRTQLEAVNRDILRYEAVLIAICAASALAASFLPIAQ